MINKEKWEAKRARRTSLQNEFKNAEISLIKIAEIAEQGPSIIDSIDQQFKEATQLTSKDVALLFVSIGLQVARWVVLSTIRPLSLEYKTELTPRDERMDAKEGDKYAENSPETRKANEKKQELVDKYDIKKSNASRDYSSDGYRTVAQILFRPVPYDAIRIFGDTTSDVKMQTANILEQILPFKMSGNTHRSLTLGHDPIWGWIFGTINILTRSITFKETDFPTFPVVEKGNLITSPQSNIILECEAALASIDEDNNRLAAAVVKQSLHFASDKYTKTGLPIPLLPPERAQELIVQNWNSAEVEKWIKQAIQTFRHDADTVAMQGALSFLINEIIRIIHILLCSEENVDNELREIRTRKIISLSNTISSASNVIYAAVRVYTSKNALEGIKVLDIGGIIETTHRLITDIQFRNEVKMEYLKEHWSNYIERELGDAHA